MADNVEATGAETAKIVADVRARFLFGRLTATGAHFELAKRVGEELADQVMEDLLRERRST